MENDSTGQGKTIKKHGGNTQIRQPEITGDSPPVAVIWGIFSGPREHIHGSFYLELDPGREQFKRFNLALYDNAAALSAFDPRDRPLLFQQSVIKNNGPNGETTQTDFDMIKTSIEKYIFGSDRRDNLYDFLENFAEKEFDKWIHDLLSTFIRKGKLEFDINGQLSSQKSLSRSMKGALAEKHGRGEGAAAQEQEEEKEKEIYHKISIVTLPIHGIPPDELMPEEDIYIRALGAVVEHFPEELRSERYDFATIPLEAVVESVKANPDLPPAYEGNPENYYEITVRFGKGEKGRGFVYKSERIKPVYLPEEDIQPDRLIPILLGTGLLASILSLIAFFIFG
ncbi:MAG: hypothetical protein ACLFN5_03555 [bacterium]